VKSATKDGSVAGKRFAGKGEGPAFVKGRKTKKAPRIPPVYGGMPALQKKKIFFSRIY
jgi:hypothetical protein